MRTLRRVSMYRVMVIDHLHLAAPDQPKAVEWYQKFIEGVDGVRVELVQR